MLHASIALGLPSPITCPQRSYQPNAPVRQWALGVMEAAGFEPAALSKSASRDGGFSTRPLHLLQPVTQQWGERGAGTTCNTWIKYC